MATYQEASRALNAYPNTSIDNDKAVFLAGKGIEAIVTATQQASQVNGGFLNSVVKGLFSVQAIPGDDKRSGIQGRLQAHKNFALSQTGDAPYVDPVSLKRDVDAAFLELSAVPEAISYSADQKSRFYEDILNGLHETFVNVAQAAAVGGSLVLLAAIAIGGMYILKKVA